MSLSAKAQLVHQRLLEFYGYPEWRDPLPAIDELVSTILSQNTNDNNRDRALPRFTGSFPNLGSSSGCAD